MTPFIKLISQPNYEPIHRLGLDSPDVVLGIVNSESYSLPRTECCPGKWRMFFRLIMMSLFRALITLAVLCH